MDDQGGTRPAYTSLKASFPLKQIEIIMTRKTLIDIINVTATSNTTQHTTLQITRSHTSPTLSKHTMRRRHAVLLALLFAALVFNVRACDLGDFLRGWCRGWGGALRALRTHIARSRIAHSELRASI
jgi:hypothetical protein